MPIRKILQMTSDREFDAARTKVFRAITLLELRKTWGVVAIPSGDFSDSTTLTICILSYTFVYSCKSVDYAEDYPFFLSSVLSSVYLLIVGVEVIVALYRTQTHELGRTPLDEGSALRRGFYLHITQHSQESVIHDPGWIRTRNSNSRSAANLRLRPRGH